MMTPRERQRPRETGQPASGAERPREARQRILAQCEALLEIGDELCDRSLSGDSESFLQQNRQEGGQ